MEDIEREEKLTQFDGYEEEEDDEDKYLGTCNGYASHPGSKSNLLLCSECADQQARTCTYRPRTPGSYSSRYIEQDRSPIQIASPRSIDHRNQQQQIWLPNREDIDRRLKKEIPKREKDKFEDDDDGEGDSSPSCEICRDTGVGLCEHCENDLICFRCQNEDNNDSSSGINGSTGCPHCIGIGSRYPVDAVVRIQVNDQTIDDSPEEITYTGIMPSGSNRSSRRSTLERLDTIVEVKNDTASEENGDDNGGSGESAGAKINGTATRYLNYTIGFPS